MKQNIIKKEDVFKKESDLTNLFDKSYKNIVSKNSLFFQLENNLRQRNLKTLNILLEMVFY